MDLSKLSPEEQEEFVHLIDAEETYKRYNKRESYLPDEGPLRRELYPRHVEAFTATASFHQVLMVAANRIGKTLAEAECATAWATGVYKPWWEGRKFDHPVLGWICGPSYSVIKTAIQEKLLGEGSDFGTGMIPKSRIKKVNLQPQTSGCFSTIEIWWGEGPKNGVEWNDRVDRWSTLQSKAYQSEMEMFVGADIDFFTCDEEMPSKIYVELLVRIMNKQGVGFVGFTPDHGFSDTYLSFFPDGICSNGPVDKYKYSVVVDWDSVPHLSEAAKEEMIAAMQPHQVLAKTKGIAYAGSGVIYPMIDAEITVEPFEIPSYWPRAYGLDPGVNRTAVVWGARDPNSDVVYIYDEFYAEHISPADAVEAIKARGSWMSGVCDPAGLGIKNFEGIALYTEYLRMGLIISVANNALEPGIFQVYQGFKSGKIKILSTCSKLLTERRLYRRDLELKIIAKKNDLIDALRYLYTTGMSVACCDPTDNDWSPRPIAPAASGRSKITGY